MYGPKPNSIPIAPKIIIKGNSRYENLDDMLEALFCDNLKSAFGIN